LVSEMAEKMQLESARDPELEALRQDVEPREILREIEKNRQE